MSTRLAEARVLVGGVWKRRGHTDSGGTPATSNRPYYGGASIAGDSPTNSTNIVSKFGAGTAARLFFSSSDITLRPIIGVGTSIVHVSWKPDMSQVASGLLDAQIDAIAHDTLFRDGDILTFHHEPDNNGWTSAQITDWKNGHNRLYDRVKAIKPGLLVAPVFTGAMFANYTSNSKRDTWCTNLRADLMGWDADGVAISNTEPNYNRISYQDETDNALAYMAHPTNSGMTAMTVGEHMTARVNPPDPDGSMRAAWFSAQHTIFESAGAYAILCWDHNMAGHNTATNFNELPNPSPELTEWKNKIALNPTTPRR